MSDDVSTPRRDITELTGELPRFVRDALGVPRPVSDVDGLAEAEREAARGTVRSLVDLGVDPDEAERAVAEDRVALVLAQQIVGDRPRYTFAEVATRSGVPEELLKQLRVASGLPLPELLGRADLRYAKRIAKLLEFLPAQTVLAAARARGTAIGTVVRADMGAVRDELLLPLRREGADELTVAATLAQAAGQLDELARELLILTYGMHLQHTLSSQLSATLTRSDVPEVTLAVGFVDVVGWTSLSSRIDPEGLDGVLDAFEHRIIEVTAPVGEVSVVKFLGDAAMLVAPTARILAETMLELTTEVEALEDVPLRGGMAAGPCLVREGDVFGNPVNLAARLTDLARPWRLLADADVADDLEQAGHRTQRLRPVRIRGVGTRRPLAVTRGHASSAADVATGAQAGGPDGPLGGRVDGAVEDPQ